MGVGPGLDFEGVSSIVSGLVFGSVFSASGLLSFPWREFWYIGGLVWIFRGVWFPLRWAFKLTSFLPLLGWALIVSKGVWFHLFWRAFGVVCSF
ncbi:hypothetical protein BDY21DRAFT_331302 [Lineolata rhizophorae]|uniref:Uncharacterized protein n=1 Tax=Lineolata rhizophorae TaxID=578093 RepID=A0A6A6PFC1_9PEZI|nr:hypothetical protein BDY21DRAFT_331302 [Lineolata rhizophorae]